MAARRWQLNISSWTPRVMFISGAAVVAHSQSEITGGGATQTIFRGETSKTPHSRHLKRTKLVKHPFKWNMELWFALKVAGAWVTFVNAHLPCGVLSLKLLPGSVLQLKWKTEDWRALLQWLSDKVLGDSLLIGSFQAIGGPLSPLCESMRVWLNAYERELER